MGDVTKILIADDDLNMQRAMFAALAREGNQVITASNGKEALEKLDEQGFDLIVTDQKMPEMSGLELLKAVQGRPEQIPVIMITAYGTVNQAVEAMQQGAADFITKPFDVNELRRVVDRVLSSEKREVAVETKQSRRGRPIITNDPLMIRVLEVAEAVAKSDATVLIQGESGTGKELVARLLHSASPRANQAFVAVNCAALPDTLLESELFGHEKGAFTGAAQRKIGKFELAQGGTILLDEISEMALPLQAKLLRVLQEHEVDRVGGRDPISIDVRVLATTNRKLEESVAKGEFRADLYYRLNVIPLTLPPLRERKGDIKLLVKHFMSRYLGEGSSDLPAPVLEALMRHPWPGNIRELQNAVERAAILSRGGVPTESDFLLNSAQSGTLTNTISIESSPEDLSTSSELTSTASLGDLFSRNNVKADHSAIRIQSGLTVAEVERALILETLRTTDYNRTQAAKLLGISIRTLRNKLSEYRHDGIDVPGSDAGARE